MSTFINITTTCPICKKESDVRVKLEDYERYVYEDASIARCFPYLNGHDCEKLITGICVNCWDNIFKDDN